MVRDSRAAAPGRSPDAATSCTRATCSSPDASRAPATGRRRRLLPDPLDGPRRRRRLRASASASGAGVRARWRAREGVGRVVYLGGLGDEPELEAPAQPPRDRRGRCAEHGPPLTYFRAAMVVGARSESYRTLRYLVERLPAMIAPSWLKTPTQPIGIDDVVAYLAQAPRRRRRRPAARSRSAAPTSSPTARCSTGWPTRSASRTRPKLPVPLLTPRLSSLWIGLVTPGRRRRRAAADRGALDARRSSPTRPARRCSTSSRAPLRRRRSTSARSTAGLARDGLVVAHRQAGHAASRSASSTAIPVSSA